MSITNPDKVVTKQDLANFYTELLPYLGGNLPVMGDIDRSDILSSTEKVVGCHTNGKPIYQRTFSDTLNPMTTTGTEAATVINIGVSVDEYISAYGFVCNGTGTYQMIPCTRTNNGTMQTIRFTAYSNTVLSDDNKNKVFINNSWMSQSTATYLLVVCYTKTTDAVNSFNYASENDYSTTEKIVGTWIDGKKIYQKTFTGTITAATTAGSPVSTYVSIGASVDHLVSLSGSYKNAANDFIMPVAVNNDYSKNSYVTVFVGSNSSTESSKKNKIVFTNCRALSFTYYVTLQYTKA